MKFETFDHIIQSINRQRTYFFDLRKFGIEIDDKFDPVNSLCKIFELEFGKEACDDLIEWYLFENVDKKIWDAKTKEVIEDFDKSGTKGLFQYLTDNYSS